MATYVFKAMDLTGAKATGEVDADSRQVVADQLKARGLIVLDISSKHGSKEISLDFMAGYASYTAPQRLSSGTQALIALAGPVIHVASGVAVLVAMGV